MRTMFMHVMLGVATTFATAISLKAQAFCALRDPVRHIKLMHERPTEYRSLVAKIDESVRGAVSELLPFTLHARELGRHTLYVLTEKGSPNGYLHARSEASPWGMVEVVWSFDEDLHVRAFRFQRCRAPGRPRFESESFHNWIEGQSFTDLLDALDDRGLVLSAKHRKRFAGEERLAVTIIRSALKAIAVTDLAWGTDIAERRLTSLLATTCGAEQFKTHLRREHECVVIGLNKTGKEVGRAVRVLEDANQVSAGRMIVFDTDRRVLFESTLPRPQQNIVAAAPMAESKPTSKLDARKRATLAAYDQ
jgi:hypothetical protein